MPRSLSIIIVTCFAVFILTVTTMLALTVLGPFTPGDAFFGVQDFAEQNWARLVWNKTSQTDYYLVLAERRTSDLSRLVRSSHQMDGLLALDNALSRASTTLAELPVKNQQSFQPKIRALIDHIQVVLLGVTGSADKSQPVFASLQNNLLALANNLETIADVDKNSPVKSGTIFQHTSINGIECVKCHAKNKPANHFSDQCGACHTSGAWTPAKFDHAIANATDCQSCHANKRPANHYEGQCSLCHIAGTTWQNVNFNHEAVGAVDCQSCHENKRPANHYSGNCSLCHNPSGWQNANFNHPAGLTDCQSCHENKRPANHYQVDCSSCHNPTGWQNAIFNHQAVGAVDCISCHANVRPADHPQGQCSNCHTAGKRWQDVNFSHSFPMNHGGANGNCSNCHPSGFGSWTCFNCHNKSEILNHHEGGLNIASRCLECHPNGRAGD